MLLWPKVHFKINCIFYEAMSITLFSHEKTSSEMQELLSGTFGQGLPVLHVHIEMTVFTVTGNQIYR